MTRSIWKIKDAGIYYLIKDLNKKFFKTQERRVVITEKLVGFEGLVYNGCRYIKLQVTSLMVGQKLGEFAPSKKSPVFLKKNSKKKKKIK